VGGGPLWAGREREAMLGGLGGRRRRVVVC